MAFVPDDAINDSFQITPAAFRLYAYICKRRNHTHKNAIIQPSSARQHLAISKAQFYRSVKELESAAWVARNGTMYVPIKGDFSPTEKYHSTVSPTRPGVSYPRPKVSDMRLTPYNHPNNHSITTDTDENSFEQEPECRNCENGIIISPITAEPTHCPQCEAGAIVKNFPESTLGEYNRTRSHK